MEKSKDMILTLKILFLKALLGNGLKRVYGLIIFVLAGLSRTKKKKWAKAAFGIALALSRSVDPMICNMP